MTHVQAEPFLYSEEELQQQFKDATHRAAAADRREPRAVTASYDKRSKNVVIELATGVVMQIPSRLLQGLAEASPQDLAAVTVSPRGTALHWETLDADFSVSGLLAGLFGTQAWMVEVGRKGGQVKSAAKAAAARANGQKGGRPPLQRGVNTPGTPARTRSPRIAGRGAKVRS